MNRAGAAGEGTENGKRRRKGGKASLAVTGSAWGTSLPLEGSVPFDSFLGFFKIAFLPDKMISGLKHKTNDQKHKTQCAGASVFLSMETPMERSVWSLPCLGSGSRTRADEESQDPKVFDLYALLRARSFCL